MYDAKVMSRDCARCGAKPSEPELLDRLIRVIDEQRGHTLAMEVEDAKIALSECDEGRDPAGNGSSPV